MNSKIKKQLLGIENTAEIITRIPANEQFIGHFQVAVASALRDIIKCLEAIAQEAGK